MFRSIIFLLFLCAMFLACSSDDSASLKGWLEDQGKAVSYEPEYREIDIPINSVVVDFNDSAYMVSRFAVLGKANGIEHTLYFGLLVHDSIKSTWTLRTDSLFYKTLYKGKPSYGDEVAVTFSWQVEDEFKPDSSWLKFLNTENWKTADTTFIFKADSFSINLPKELLNVYTNTNKDSLNLLIKLTLHEKDDMVLRIAPPYYDNIENLIRVAQQPILLEDCKTCLYAGIRDSAKINFDMSNVGVLGKTVVFAQLVFPRTDKEAKSEFNYPIPFLVYDENYSFDAPNLLFWGNESDSIEIQVTRGLRKYGTITEQPNTLEFMLRFGYPKYPDSSYFYDYPDYAKYNFAALIGENAKLRLWLADYGSQK